MEKSDRKDQQQKSLKSKLSKQDEVEDSEDASPSSETSDATVIPAGGSDKTAVVSSNGSSPESGLSEKDATASQVIETENLEKRPQESIDAESPMQGSNSRVKLLVRSHALCDDASPPPEDAPAVSISACSNGGTTTTATTTTTGSSPIITTDTLSTPTRGSHRFSSLEKDESQGSVTSLSSLTSPCLSRDSSTETYTDSKGVDLEEFIKQTLNKNQKDRLMLIKLESDLHNFIKDPKHEYLKFPQMSSYHRMLVHRTAAFFGLDHNVDPSGKAVIVNCTANTRIPDFNFKDYLKDEIPLDDQPKKQILKRESASFEEGRQHLSIDKKSKSFEEREEDYKKARDRIFSQQECCAMIDGVAIDPSVAKVCVEHSSGRSSKEDLRWTTDARPWSSTDSSGYSTDSSSKLRVNITKASSFGGITVLSRAESKANTFNGGLSISKTDSLSSGASSNLSSPMNRPPPISTSPSLDAHSKSACSPSHSFHKESPVLPPILQISGEDGQPMAVWVASTLDTIPAGSLIINPQTCEPFKNPDGSMFRFQPPPKISVQDHQCEVKFNTKKKKVPTATLR